MAKINLTDKLFDLGYVGYNLFEVEHRTSDFAEYQILQVHASTEHEAKRFAAIAGYSVSGMGQAKFIKAL